MHTSSIGYFFLTLSFVAVAFAVKVKVIEFDHNKLRHEERYMDATSPIIFKFSLEWFIWLGNLIIFDMSLCAISRVNFLRQQSHAH